MQVMHQERPFQMQNLWNAQFTFLAPHLCKAQSDFPNNAMLQKWKTVIGEVQQYLQRFENQAASCSEV